MAIIEATAAPTPTDDERRAALAERLFESLSKGVQLLTVELGARLGLYEALRSAKALTPSGLADAAGIHPRYAREWLEQQAVSGYIEVAVESDDGERRAYCLPPSHADVLLCVEHPAYTAPAGTYLVGLARVIDKLVDAYRTGGGVPYAAYEGFGGATAGFSRPIYANALGEWVAAMPDVAERLRGGGRAFDVGCGHGFAAIALARLFPAAEVVGIDIDGESIAAARANATAAGLGDRLQFVHAGATGLDNAGIGTADLVMVIEALHDMGDPVGALRAIGAVLSDGGVALVADERVGDEFTVDAGDYERMMFCMSVLHCLPATRASGTIVDAGTVLRPSTVQGYASAAGFATTTLLPIDFVFWNFYRLDR
jgi:SAM-dependent methyltransferase